MPAETPFVPNRRDVLASVGTLAASSALAGVALPSVHPGEDNTIRVALIGCGGRGTGAAENALRTQSGPIKLVAMADVFPNRLRDSFNSLQGDFKAQMDVPEERRFIGFDAYKNAMDCLRPGDICVLATPPAFRWPHFQYAIEKGIHTFMEKPVTVDGPSSRRMLKLGEDAAAKNLKVGVGLMCRHCEMRKQLLERIEQGEIGDIILLRAYRQHPRVGHCFVGKKPDGINELMYQVREFHAFLWASGGLYSDFLIHNIDECCWMKGGWPVQAKGVGGRHYRGKYVDQNFDTYSVEYTFADGAKFFLECRIMQGCNQEFASYAHGSKGMAVISQAGHSPARCRTYKGQNPGRDNLIWQCPRREPNPYQLEWDHLVQAIREDRPHNEVKRGVEASLVTAMGRMACHTGQVITYEQMLNHDHELAPQVGEFTMESSAPVQPDADGKYPVPEPGVKKNREC